MESLKQQQRMTEKKAAGGATKKSRRGGVKRSLAMVSSPAGNPKMKVIKMQAPCIRDNRTGRNVALDTWGEKVIVDLT